MERRPLHGRGRDARRRAHGSRRQRRRVLRVPESAGRRDGHGDDRVEDEFLRRCAQRARERDRTATARRQADDRGRYRAVRRRCAARRARHANAGRAVNALTIDMLTWFASREVTYDEAIDAWHSHCPRLTIWEDALADKLIRIDRGVVTVTERGRAALTQ